MTETNVNIEAGDMFISLNNSFSSFVVLSVHEEHRTHVKITAMFITPAIKIIRSSIELNVAGYILFDPRFFYYARAKECSR